MSNCEIALMAARVLTGEFPLLDLYVPANAERFVYEAFNGGYLTDVQILEIDCCIISQCDVLLVYEFDESKGIEIEAKYAEDHNIPILRFKEINESTLAGIKSFLEDHMINELGAARYGV
jgi:hypothetical protein